MYLIISICKKGTKQYKKKKQRYFTKSIKPAISTSLIKKNNDKKINTNETYTIFNYQIEKNKFINDEDAKYFRNTHPQSKDIIKSGIKQNNQANLSETPVIKLRMLLNEQQY